MLLRSLPNMHGHFHVQVTRQPAVHIEGKTAAACRAAAAETVRQDSHSTAHMETVQVVTVQQPMLKKRRLALPRFMLPAPTASRVAGQRTQHQSSATASALSRSASAAQTKQPAASAATTASDDAIKGTTTDAAVIAAAPMVADATVAQHQLLGTKAKRKLAVTAACTSVAAKSMLQPADEHATGEAGAATACHYDNAAHSPAQKGLQLEQRAEDTIGAALSQMPVAVAVSASSSLFTDCALDRDSAAAADAASLAVMPAMAEADQRPEAAAASAGLLLQVLDQQVVQRGKSLQETCVIDEKHSVATEQPAALRATKRRPQRLPAVLTSTLPALKGSCGSSTLGTATLLSEQHRAERCWTWFQ
jgi:hypothetical protein